MLNRRYLRIKAYQALYAFWQSDGGSAAKVEKELLLSIERTYDQYVALMLLFGELRHYAERRIEERRNKHLPTAGDLEASRKFVDGTLLQALSGSVVLQTEGSRRRVSWVGEQEMVGKLFRQIEGGPLYQAYMADPLVNFNTERSFLGKVFAEHVANFEPLHDHYEGRSIYWLEDTDLACSLAMRTLEGAKASQLDELCVSELRYLPDEDGAFVTDLYRKVVEWLEEHGKAIAAKASNWETERIALSDLILMHMALSEVRAFSMIPVKVTLNEYIEIAKAYSTPKSTNFINGILDSLFHEMKADGRIRKVGRGLIEN
jgi:transcription antitermination protein NusB